MIQVTIIEVATGDVVVTAVVTDESEIGDIFLDLPGTPEDYEML